MAAGTLGQRPRLQLLGQKHFTVPPLNSVITLKPSKLMEENRRIIFKYLGGFMKRVLKYTKVGC